MSKLHRHYFSRFVIDEMHCVEIWGESFRYEYKNLSKIISDVSNHYGTKIVLLTASASKKRVESTFQGLRNNKNINPIVVQKDIVRQEIKINKAIEITDESSRPKISISIIKNQLANNKNSKALVFTAFAKDTVSGSNWNCERLCEYYRNNASDLELKSSEIDYYHAQLPLEQREQIQTSFAQGKIRLLICTKAFGMGVDIKGIRAVIHCYPPITPEEYYQEIGRGGRDSTTNEPCIAQMLWSLEDENTLRLMIRGRWDVRLLQKFFYVAYGKILLDEDGDLELCTPTFNKKLQEFIDQGLIEKEEISHKGAYKFRVYSCTSKEAARSISSQIAELKKTGRRSSKDLRRLATWLFLYSTSQRNGVFYVPPKEDRGPVNNGGTINDIKHTLSIFEDFGWVSRSATDEDTNYSKHSRYKIEEDEDLSKEKIKEFFDNREEYNDKQYEAWRNIMEICQSDNVWGKLKALFG